MEINQATIDQIKKLGLSEKILIVEEIWDSILSDQDYPELTDKQLEVLNERIETYHADPRQGKSWDDIKNEYRMKKNQT